MKFTEFQDFFKTYVKQYAPYKDSKVFQLFVDFMSGTYYSDSYTSIPASFKSAFEEQVIPSEFITPFLKSIGIPSETITTLSNGDKFKIMTSLSDFHRYKGTIKVIDSLISTFNVNDNLAAYELYLDFSIDINGQRIWEVLPRLIKGTATSTTLSNSELFALLDSTPNWLIDASTLDSLYMAGEIELPYKTPAILLDSTAINDLSAITQVVSAAVLETLKDTKVQIFFNSGTYLSTLSAVNALWFYIEHAVTNIGTTQVSNELSPALTPAEVFARYEIPNALGQLPRGGSNSLYAPLTNIQTLLDEYYNLSDSLKISKFKEKYIDIFQGFSIIGDMPFLQYRSRVVITTGVELLNYIDARLNTAINRRAEGNNIIGELHNSLLTFVSLNQTIMDMSYFNYYLLNLPGLLNDIKSSTTYMLLTFLKPYHSDLISRTNYQTIIKNKFDNGLASYASVMSMSFNSTSVIEPSYLVLSNTIKTEFESSPIISDTLLQITYKNKFDNVIASYASATSMSFNSTSVIEPSYLVLSNTIKTEFESSPIISDIMLQIIYKSFSTQISIMSTGQMIDFTTNYASVVAYNDVYGIQTTSSIVDNLVVLDPVDRYIYDNPVTGVHIIYNN